MESKNIEFALPPKTILKGNTKEYRIESVLGQGGFGITYKVTAEVHIGNITQYVPFAIKEHFIKGICHRGKDNTNVEFPISAAKDYEDSMLSFTNEGKRLNKVCKLNRGIVDVNEVFQTNNTAYYVMEYLEGGDLRQMVKSNEGGLSEAKALSVILPIAEAVESLHRQNLLHLDIKPENIVIRQGKNGAPDEPVLIDFGIALHFDSKGKVTTKVATGVSDGYSPKEQYAGVLTFAPWIDVYSLAATYFYLLTGKDPIGAFELDKHPNYVQSSLPEHVSERTRLAIIKAMNEKYTERTQSVKTFISNIESSLAMPNGHVLRGGHFPYRIVNIEEERANCIIYKAVIDTGATRGRSTTRIDMFTVYEFYAKDSGAVKRTPDGSIIGLAPHDKHKEAFIDYCRQARKLTGLKASGEENVSGIVMNCEFFEANGTFYFVKRDRWSASIPFISKPIKQAVVIVVVMGLIVGLAVLLLTQHKGERATVITSDSIVVAKDVLVESEEDSSDITIVPSEEISTEREEADGRGSEKEESQSTTTNGVNVNASSSYSNAAELPESSTSTGTLDMGGAIWNGGIKNGKPHGTGTLKITSTYTLVERRLEKGYSVQDAVFENGNFDHGKIYNAQGECIESYYP